MVVSQGEIIDHGGYTDLIMRSKILRDFVHSTTATDTEQVSSPMNEFGNFTDGSRSVPATPLERIHNPFRFSETDIEPDESEPMIVEIEEEKKKIIQTETIQTGSVSYSFIFFITINNSL